MKKRILKKSLVISIMLLFIGMSIVSSTGNMVSNDDTHCFDLFNRSDYTAYGYCLNDTGELVEGPVTFSIEDPENITQLWATSSSSPMTGGTWTWDGWYCCEYGSGDLWTIDWDSGYMVEIGGGGVHLNGLTWSSYDSTFGSSNTSLYKIDEDTGEQTLIGSFDLPEGRRMGGIGYDYSDNILYGIEYVKNDLYMIDIETGEAALIGPLGIEINGVSEFDMAPFDFNFYLSTFTTQGELYKIDTEIGECTLIGEFQDGAEISALTIPDRFYQPTANFSWAPQNPHAGETIAFNASSSQGPHCEITLYEWDWDNDLIFDEKSTNPITSHMWDDEGSYPVTLLVHDDVNRTDTQTHIVRIYHIFYVGGSGPNNYTKIQDAIDNASDGDTVFVYNGIYELDGRININKSINLIGENKHNTIINGSGIEIVVSEVHVSSFTIQGGGGILILSDNSTISGNLFKSDEHAMGLGGIQTSKAYNTISHNTFLNCGLFTDGSFHNSVYNNTVNGKPLVYLEDESDMVVDDAGQVILVDCENINIENLELTNTIMGIQLIHSTDCLISGNKISNNYIWGISLLKSNNITISGNVILNEIGVLFLDSKYNTISGNNFEAQGFNLIFENSSGNCISDNNFRYSWYLYKGIFSIDSDNKWNGNYWNRPRILPVLIWGVYNSQLPLRYCLDFDWRPAREPYDI